MWEIYWLTRLEGLHVLFAVLIFTSSVIFIGHCFYVLLENIDTSDSKYLKYIKRIKKSLIYTIILGLLLIFTPNEKQLLAILGIGGTIDYIQSNETAKQLPDKCIIALDEYLNHYINKDKNE